MCTFNLPFGSKKRFYMQHSLFLIPFFPAQRIVASQFFKELGFLFQQVAVSAGVVQLQYVFFGVGGGNELFGEGGGFFEDGYGLAEVFAEGGDGHAGGIGFSVGGISGYVGGAYVDFFEELRVDVGFVFPGVDDGNGEGAPAEGFEEGCVVYYFASTAVYEYFESVVAGEVVLVYQVVGGVQAFAYHGGVEGEYVAGAFQLFEGVKGVFI